MLAKSADIADCAGFALRSEGSLSRMIKYRLGTKATGTHLHIGVNQRQPKTSGNGLVHYVLEQL